MIRLDQSDGATVCGRKVTVADEFTIESRTVEAITVRHAAHGHRYTFIVTEVPPNARVLRLGPAQPNAKASLPSAAFATAARAFAEREARKANLIELRATVAARERVRYEAMFTTHRKQLRHGYGHG